MAVRGSMTTTQVSCQCRCLTGKVRFLLPGSCSSAYYVAGLVQIVDVRDPVHFTQPS